MWQDFLCSYCRDSIKIFIMSAGVASRKMRSKTRSSQGKKPSSNGDLSASYNKFKKFEGREYTGMRVGRSHKWYYDKGEWKEKKITPDLWEISYSVTKRRAGKAPDLIKFLQEFIAQLEKEPVPLQLEYNGKTYKGEAVRIPETCHDGVCPELDITLNDEHLGILHNMKSGWKMDEVKDQKLIDAIGHEVLLWYE